MTVIYSSPEDLINAALAQIGYTRRIGSIFEGSPASKIALDIYSQTRDQKLDQFEWGFAERNLNLTLLKTAPPGGYGAVQWTNQYPILPWIYEYAYPDDMLKLRSLRGTPIFIPQFDPKPITFRIANDSAYNPARKVILTNLASATAVYTGQVSDPSSWEPGFTAAMLDALSVKLAPGCLSEEQQKIMMAKEPADTAEAETQLG